MIQNGADREMWFRKKNDFFPAKSAQYRWAWCPGSGLFKTDLLFWGILLAGSTGGGRFCFVLKSMEFFH